MAARDLRYNWFEELRNAFNFDFILTAHHANDNLETFIINLVRGTGLEGLTGIKEDNNYIIRPLLSFSRAQLESYAKNNNLKWREDSSNASTKYMRNKVRHQVVPTLEELNPQLLQSFEQTQEHLKDSFNLIEDYIGLLYSEIVTKTRFGYQLKIETLRKIPNTKAVLYQLLRSFGFTEWNDVYHLLEAQPGKIVFSNTHRLIKDREFLVLTEIPNDMDSEEFTIPEGEEIVMLPIGTFTIYEVANIEENSHNCIYVPKEKLIYPLVLRKWKEGDYFYPFGMKGKKKLSDFFKDKKLSLPEKENIWLLFSGEEIVWVVNHRADNRFAITDSTQNIIKITYAI
jgi:tRNA(Ile)-lysidine synthase